VNWSDESRQLAWLMSCDQADSDVMDAVYVATNTAHYASWFDLPPLPSGYGWLLHFNTGDNQSPNLTQTIAYANHGILVGERSVVIFSASPLET
jgi:hypothetical protein